MRLKNRILVGFAGSLLAIVCLIPGLTWALTIGGTPIVAIDGDSDRNVTVNILSTGITGDYSYGYFLNGGSTFHSFPSILDVSIGVNNIRGGDVLDFSLYDGTKYYTLSGDQGDSSYSVKMVFSDPVTEGSPQRPSNWTDPYYYDANITWYLPGAVSYTSELAFNIAGTNDGLAPLTLSSSSGIKSVSVPEPSSLILLGFGLACLAMWGRKKFRESKY